ncbi:MAG TPA: glycosyltransferase family 1 protein [Herpetosiphonaceae bacterium]
MRIAISGMFWTEPHVGSGQYLHNLIEQFSAQPHGHRFILVIPRYRLSQKPSLPHIQTVLMPTPFDGRNENLAKVWFEQIAIGQVCRKLRVDLVHVPYFGSPRFPRVPTVVTVHDLIPVLVPGNRGGRAVQLYMRLAASSARRASTIIADSRHTKQDVVDHLRIAADRVVVTHLAAAPTLQPQPAETIAEVARRFRLNDPYVLYIGGFQAHKNVATAIRAFARTRRMLDHRVVLAIAGRLPTSQSALFPDIHRVILEEKIAADVALLGPVSDAEKAALMSGCQAFLFPSRYEGFGLPPLEAMQCGAPVLASATTSVGEVVGDGGVPLSPEDVDGWASALARVLRDADWRAELAERGLRRAGQFNWQTTAEQTLAIYERHARR